MEKVKINKIIILSFVILFILTVVALANMNRDEDLGIVEQVSLTLSEDWVLHYGDFMAQEVELPTDLNLTPGVVYEAYRRLPNVDDKMNYILLRSSMQDMIVYLEDEEIYHYEKPQDLGFTRPVASVWLLVRLPNHFQGKVLKLVFKSEVDAFSGIINEVKLAEPSTLIYNVVKDSFVGFVVFLLLFSIGMLITIISIFTKNVEDNRFLYLGMLSVVSSIWILSEARIMQFFTGNRYIIGGISYLMVPLMGIFFSLYVKEAILIKNRHKQFMQVISVSYLLFLIITIILQLLGISTFIHSFKFTFIVMLFNTAVFFVSIIFELVIYNNKKIKQFLKYISVIVISVLLEGIVFYRQQFDYTSDFLRLGILIFVCLLLVDSYNYLKMNFEKQKEQYLLEKLAYKDFLTKAYNRAAFERDLERLINKDEGVFRLVLLDLNELKYVNDHYGHAYGDEAIKIVYNTMNESFSSFGVCYRMGGDEFAILMEDTNEELFEMLSKEFKKELKQVASKLPYPLDVAVGTDIYSVKKWENYTLFYHQVDQKMYENKLQMKQKRII
ncbi:MAG: diguanylate cyclase [Clostridia bacterium]|nr:diguanylate cyclase [Clostridia bacterium]